MSRNHGLPSFVTRALLFGLWACALIILISTYAFRPHWGLMDDASIIFRTLPGLDKAGFWASLPGWVEGDLIWGMLRPVYPFLMKVIYEPGIHSAPWVTYAWTAFLSILLLVGLARFFGRLLGLPWLGILAINACFFYQYDLLQHPSLQEKLLLLFGLGFCFLASKRTWIPLLFLVGILGFLSKASFVVYFVPGFLIFSAHEIRALLKKEKVAWRAWALLALLGVAAVLVLWKVASRPGAYTATYSAGNIIPNLLSFNFHFLFWPVALHAFLFFRQGKRSFQHLEEAAPMAGVAAFLLLFLPWGLAAYLQTLVGPLYSVLILQILWRTTTRARPALLLCAMGLALVVCAYRVPTMFLRLRDLGQIVENWEVIGKGETQIAMPCLEGGDSMDMYLKQRGIEGVTVKLRQGLPTAGRSVWIYDRSSCPLPGRVMDPPGCTQEIRYGSVWKNSFRVVVFQCEGPTSAQ